MFDRRQILAGAIATPICASAANAANPSRADLSGDIAILRQALALHRGLYRYSTPARIDARIKALEASFVAAPDLTMRYLALSRFLATILCGHSYCNFYNQAGGVAGALFDRRTRLPFHFLWLGGRMIVTRNLSGIAALLPGTEVIAVNDVPASAMLERLLPYARADGHNDAKRVSLLEVRGDDRIEYFDVFHGLTYGVPPAGTHRLSIQTPGGTTMTIEVPAMTLAERRARMTVVPIEGDTPAWQWHMRLDDVAVLTMPSWALYDSKWDWKGWLDDRLGSLGGARGLVIDLRGNEGGEDCGDRILGRLTARDFTPPGFVQRLRFHRTPAAIDRYLDTWDNSFRTLGVGGADLPGGFVSRPDGDAITAIPAIAPRIACPVAALIGPANSSATFQFASAAKVTGLIRLFGGTTGGNRRGINGGCFFFVRLPASGIEFDLPLVGNFATTWQPDSGVAPDVPLFLTPADIAAGRDPVMAGAAAWIARG